MADENPSDAITRRLADALIRRLFAVGLDLHGALAHIDPGDVAAHKVRSAICGLDVVIKDVRAMIFDLGQGLVPTSVRTLVVDAVERACEHAACDSPTIVFGQGVDAVSEQITAQRVARLIHEVLTRVPGDRLPAARVEVAADSRPPPRMVANIDIPGDDVAELAGKAQTTGLDVSWQTLTPATARIHVVCRPVRREPKP